MSGYTERSTALAVRPNRPRLRMRHHIRSSDTTVRTARPVIVATMSLAIAVCVLAGVKETCGLVYRDWSTRPVSR